MPIIPQKYTIMEVQERSAKGQSSPLVDKVDILQELL